MTHALLELRQTPNTRELYLRAALGALLLPLLSDRSDTLPDRRVEVRGVRVDPDNLAAYAKTCGLRFGETLPITYPFTLTFPAVMKLVVARDFPFAAVGAVHAENVIEQRRRVSVSEPLDIRAHTETLRERRKGLLVDAVSEVSVGRELAWRQVTTFLHQQKTSLSDELQPESPPEHVPPPPTRTLRADQRTIGRNAAASGDRNPMHVSTLGAKAFGFPRADRTWNVECGCDARRGGGTDSGASDLPGDVRQADLRTVDGQPVRRRVRPRLGSVAAAPDKGVSAPYLDAAVGLTRTGTRGRRRRISPAQ